VQMASTNNVPIRHYLCGTKANGDREARGGIARIPRYLFGHGMAISHHLEQSTP
jgi:hypothetical protein